jgi:hypothetical protein
MEAVGTWMLGNRGNVTQPTHACGSYRKQCYVFYDITREKNKYFAHRKKVGVTETLQYFIIGNLRFRKVY